jgi:hypothetical protein
MKYFVTNYVAPGAQPAYGSPEFDALVAEYSGVAEKTKYVATIIAGEGLQDIATATTLRNRGGKVETADGPFAATREHLAGFYLIEAPDLDAALRFAAEVPATRHGSVEVRPVINF